MPEEIKQLPIYSYATISGVESGFYNPQGGRWIVLCGAGDDDLHVIVLGSDKQKTPADHPIDADFVARAATEAVRRFKECK